MEDIQVDKQQYTAKCIGGFSSKLVYKPLIQIANNVQALFTKKKFVKVQLKLDYKTSFRQLYYDIFEDYIVDYLTMFNKKIVENYMPKHSSKLFSDFSCSFFAGLCSGSIATAFVYPTDIITKSFLTKQSSGRFQIDLFQTISQIYKSKGFSGFYRGFDLELGYIGPFNALKTGFSFLMKKTLSDFQKKQTTLFQNIMILTMASQFSYLVFFPLNKLKNQMINQTLQGKERGTLMKNISIIYQKKGIPGFYKGLYIEFIERFSLCFMTYTFREILKLQWAEQKENVF